MTDDVIQELIDETSEKAKPDLIRHIHDKLREHLLHYQITPRHVETIAVEVSEAIRNDLGGTQLYITKGDLQKLVLLRWTVYQRLRNGARPNDLAAEFGYSTQQIYKISAWCREQERAKRQPLLPGIDEVTR